MAEDNEISTDPPKEKPDEASDNSPFTERLNSFKYVEPRRSLRSSSSTASNASRSFATPTASFSSRARPQSSQKVSSKSTTPEATSRISKKPKRKQSAGYTQPARYAHLPLLPDVLEPGLICAFVGLNPGIATSTQGHAYAHPSNLFWKLLHSSGLTDRRLSPEEDRDLPRLFSMGYTNIVERPTKDQSELSKEEMVAGTAILDAKFLRYKPEAVVIVGKAIWEAVWKYRHGRTISRTDFHYGWQEETENIGKGENGGVLDDQGNPWEGARVFVATTTSGLSAGLKPAEKEAVWKPLGAWVKQRRLERSQGLTATKPESDHWLRKSSAANNSLEQVIT